MFDYLPRKTSNSQQLSTGQMKREWQLWQPYSQAPANPKEADTAIHSDEHDLQSPDADCQRRYNRGQKTWRRFSESVIQQLSHNVPEDFVTCYTQLAKKRREIAIILQHGAREKESPHVFGKLRAGPEDRLPMVITPNTHIPSTRRIERVRPDNPNDAWATQASAIYTACKRLIDRAEGGDRFLNVFVKEESELSEPYKCSVKIYTLSLPQPGKQLLEHVTEYKDINSASYHSLSLITLNEVKTSEKSFWKITVEYTDLDHRQRFSYYEFADMLYREILEWKPEDGFKEYLFRCGLLLHYLANMLFAHRGGAAIAEWLIRGLSLSKGIELGAFNQAEPLSWHWKALLTPDREFAEWFAYNALECCVIPYQASTNALKTHGLFNPKSGHDFCTERLQESYASYRAAP